MDNIVENAYMKIATLINAHSDENLLKDTLDSVRRYCTEDAMILIDGCSWENWGSKLDLGVECIPGLLHGKSKSPYRNVAYGLKVLSEKFHDADWYCYVEQDVLFASERFKIDLREATKRSVYCMGNDFRYNRGKDLKILQRMLGKEVGFTAYLLGCCVFYSKAFVDKLLQMKFFDRFLVYTNDFDKGNLPGYADYDISEHLYPTLALVLGGRVEPLGFYDSAKEAWGGDFKTYLMRFRPQINYNVDPWMHASILHPIKNYNDPIRNFFRLKRESK